MNEPADPDVPRHDSANTHVRVRMAGIGGQHPIVRRGLGYRATSGTTLPMDIHEPDAQGGLGASAAGQPGAPPVVLLPTAYPDPAGRFREWRPVRSWARLLTASGMSAVVFATEHPADDVHALLAHLRATAAQLHLDAGRCAVLASSANVTVALSALMRDATLACAACLYGYTMDLDGSTTVADAATRYGFVDACAGRSVDDLPAAVPILFVRAGRDQFAGLNEALDRVVSRGLERNLPVTLVNHATGAHGFDVEDDTAPSRAVVQQVLAFLRAHLTVVPQGWAERGVDLITGDQ